MTIKFQARGSCGEIWLYDQVGQSFWGDGVTAKSFQKDLAALGKVTNIDLRINSPGGDVTEARAMTAAIVAHTGKVISHIDGLAASAATYLALAGDKVHITDGGLFMVHNSWTLAWGNKHEMRSTADLLDKIDGTIANDYARKTGATAEQIAAWNAKHDDAGLVFDGDARRVAAGGAAVKLIP